MDKQGISQLYQKYSNTKPLSSAIYKTVYFSIICGYLSSGDRITIDGLANLCFASRTPVREAVRQLVQDGILSYDQRFGYFVRIYSEKECLDLFEVLHILQIAAVRIAATTISPSYLMMLEKNVDLCKTDMDDVDFFRLNRDFHMIVAKSTGNTFLAQSIENVYSRLFLFDFAKHPVLNKEVSIAQHKNMIAALRAQDADEAVRVHEEHAKVTGNYRRWALDSELARISEDVL